MTSSASNSQSSAGSLTILEAETGAGKTEAALEQFRTLKARGLCDSFYFALPTRTSAAQIYNRTKETVSKILHPVPQVILAVPGYMVPKAGPHAVVADNGYESDDAPWHIQNSNRYLSAPVAVGTIDQALYAITGSKHATMRWASMGRSLIVVDEVHASDEYMSYLLEAIVERHIERGGHILLMSATLGSAASSRFIRAAGVRGFRQSNLPDAIVNPYPLAQVVQNGTLRTIPLADTSRRKDVQLELASLIDDPAAVARLAADHVKRGAKVLVIRNSVKSCIEVQQELESILQLECLMRVRDIPVPHHGRYAAEDRAELDAAIEGFFGKKSETKPLVAVGTQTIEQSLDIDADIIITDACPMDVLLQRLGRLHRHMDKARPAGYERPTAIVLTPEKGFKPFINKAGHGFGRDRAYENVVQVMATCALIKERQSFDIPKDNRELVERATHAEALSSCTEGDLDLRRHLLKAEGNRQAERSRGGQAVRSAVWRYGDPVGNNWSSSPTRLGDSAMRMEFEMETTTFMGNSISGISIPYWMIEGSKKIIDQRKTPVITTGSQLEFPVGDKVLTYSRYGLELSSESKSSY